MKRTGGGHDDGAREWREGDRGEESKEGWESGEDRKMEGVREKEGWREKEGKMKHIFLSLL